MPHGVVRYITVTLLCMVYNLHCPNLCTIQHLTLAIWLGIVYFSPSVPVWVAEERARLEHRRREALKVCEPSSFTTRQTFLSASFSVVSSHCIHASVSSIHEFISQYTLYLPLKIIAIFISVNVVEYPNQLLSF